ncbi:MAG: 2'-5' RNA ligase family protein [Candidatus Liptonbacteria bacterium]|nr:2'-5' RNA ligase family protein [Candidatus Liptonbacteria bacterium]
MAEIWPGFYDIIILPPEPIQRQAIKLSAWLHENGSPWKLGAEEFLPHLSLYHLPVRPEKFREFTGALDDVVCGFRGGDLRLTGVSVRRIHRAVFLTTDKPKWLSDLHLLVIKALRHFFDEARREEIRTRWGKMTPGMRNGFRSYGTPMTQVNFVPHLTLGTFRWEDEEEKFEEGLRGLKAKPEKFHVDRVHVGRVGTGFSCQEVIHEARF